ncbi:unnamed protein product, partial [Discosporangium mesarthrocarpum]
RDTTYSHSGFRTSHESLGDAAKEAVYQDSFIRELGPLKMEIITIHEDNMGALPLASNKISSTKTKHIHVRYHFLKQLVREEKIRMSTWRARSSSQTSSSSLCQDPCIIVSVWPS